MERLEERTLLSGISGFNETFATGLAPLAAEVGLFDQNGTRDAAVLNSDGSVTVALNSGADTWSVPQTHNFGIGAAYGMESAPVDSGFLDDLIVQTADSIIVFVSQGDGTFFVSDTLTPGPAGGLAPVSGDRVEPAAAALLNGDFAADLAVVAPGSNEVLVFAGNGDGTFSTATRLASGGIEPVSVVAGNLIGAGFPDLAVAHRDGTVAFHEGHGDGTFTRRDDLSVAGLGVIKSLAAADLNGDGEDDLVVSAGDRVTVLTNDSDFLTSSPIENGDFAAGLTAWNTEITGHRSGGIAGTVDGLNGYASLIENESFLVSLSQTFVVPDTPQTLSLDILSLDLVNSLGGIPDAFEISLLDGTLNSLVPTFRSEATSFFNASDGVVSMAGGVTYSGTTVTLDISGLAPGTEATLYFDLVGSPPETASSVAIDNVEVLPEALFAETMTAALLPGPFLGAADVAVGDVDGDGQPEIVVADSDGAEVLVFSDDGSGGWARQEFDVSGYGLAPTGLALGPLTAGSTHDDIAVTLRDSNLLLSPLAVDSTPPEVALLSPTANQATSDSVTEIRLQFSEAMRDSGTGGDHSVTNPAAYRLFAAGPNGLLEAGGGDDVAVAIESVSYDAMTNEVVAGIAASALPLSDGAYLLQIEGDDPALSLQDAAGNALSGGTDAEFTFTINSEGPINLAAAPVSGTEGVTVALNATFDDPGGSGPYTATIDWGDGTTASGTVTFASGSGTVTADHVYADNGTYAIGWEITDPNGITATQATTASIDNTAPQLTAAADVTIARTATLSQVLATFTDPGFSRAAAGTTETFTATIDWGDGSPVEAGTVDVTQGSEGIATSGTVSGAHAFLLAGTYATTVTLSDDDGGTASVALNVIVTSTAPQLDPLSGPTGNEGETLILNGTFQASELGAPFTATIDWGDGSTSSATVSFASGAGTITAGHAFPDDGSYSIRVDLTNSFGETDSQTATATVSNVAPTVTAAGDLSVTEDELLSALLATFSDPGFDNSAGETVESFTATVDWGDGTPVDAATIAVVPGSSGQPTTGTVTGEHVYVGPGDFTITVTVDDQDGGIQSVTLSVSVAPANVPPTILSIDSLTGDEGKLLTLNGTFTDNEDDLLGHTVTIDWGDGSTSSGTITQSGSTATVTSDHVYADNGSYPVTMTVLDPLGESAQTSVTAVVSNVAPELVMTSDRRITAGDLQTLVLGSFTDPGFTSVSAGTLETFSATIDWGDGSPLETASIDVTQGSDGVLTTGTISGTHAYPALGTYTVTVSLQDDDGAAVTGTVVFTAVSKFFVVDQSDHSFYKYDRDLDLLDHQDLGQNNSSPRGADTNPAGDRLWVVDSSRNVFVYQPDGTLLGTWKSNDATQPQGIATDGTHIWIIGVARDAVYFYENGASFLSGEYTANSSFDVDPSSNKGSGLVTDGTRLWASDEDPSNPRMFVYGLDGTVLGIWQLDPANGDPTGVALDPQTGDLWITDRHDAAVYQYAAAASRLDGSQTAAAVFALDPSNPNPEGIADPVALISIGDTVSDSIAVAGEVDDWQFNATAGQSIYIDFDVVSGGPVVIRLLVPDGTELLVDSSSLASLLDNGPLLLGETGVYTLRVHSSSTDTPIYQFTLWEVPPDDTATVAIGGIATGGIEVPGAVDHWTFTAPADQWVYFDFQQWTGGNVHLTLTDPGGSAILTDFGTLNALDNGPLLLTTAGTYTLTLDGFQDHTSTYQFQLFDATPDEATIQFGDTATGAIDNPGDKDIWSFDAVAGDAVFIDWLVNSDGTTQWQLYSPTNALLLSRANFLVSQLDGGPVDLAETGTYRIEVTGLFGTLPSYQFQLIGIPAPDEMTYTIGNVAQGAIEVLGATDRWSFDAVSGQSIFIDYHAVTGGTLEYFLYAPDGALVATAADFLPNGLDNGPIALGQTGTHVLEVVGKFSGTPEYTFQIWDVPPPDVSTYLLEGIAYGDIETPGVHDEWTLTGSTGQQIFLDTQEIDGGTLTLQLEGPSGELLINEQDFLLGGLDAGPVTLPADGTYTLKAFGLGDDTPEYRFRIFDVTPAAPVPIVVDQVVSGSIDVPGQIDRYSFDAAAGQDVQLDVLFNPSNVFGAFVGFTLLDPAGTPVISGTTGDTTLTLPSTGSYTLVVDQSANVGSDAVSHYSFRVVDPAAVPPLPAAANLVVTDSAAPSVVVADPATLEVSWTVTNTGTATTDAGQWIDRVFLSIDGLFQRAFDEAVAVVPRSASLAPGSSYSQTVSLPLPAGFKGDVTVIVETDSLNEVFEDQAEFDNTAVQAPTAVYRSDLVSGPPAITIDQQNGDQFPAGFDLVLSGQADAYNGTANLIFAVDVSASTNAVQGLDANFDGIADADDDLNGDGNVGNILDVEIGALLRLVGNLRDNEIGANVAIVALGSDAESLDLSPRLFWQSFASPNEDADTNGLFDVDEAALSLRESGADLYKDVEVSFGTNFTATIREVDALMQRTQAADRNQVLFLTDGVSSAPPLADLQQLAARGIEFHGFQITGDAVTAELQFIADTIDADPASSGDATPVSDPADLAGALVAGYQVDRVTINGVDAEILDAAGHFFHTVTLLPGENTFTVEAVDTGGRASIQTVTLTGVDPAAPLDFGSLDDVTLLADLRYHVTTFNRATGTLHTEVTLTNNAAATLDPPVLAIFERISPAEVELANPNGLHPDSGRPYVNFDGEIDTGGLLPGATSASIPLQFANGNRQRFQVETSLHVRGNSPPFFTSTPVTTADVGVPLTETVTADDLDGHALAFDLLIGAAGMTLDPLTGVLNWTPDAGQVGLHDVQYRVTDGHGGQATRVYQIFVGTPQADLSPVFQTQPASLIATQDEEFRYASVATDPEGLTVSYALDAAPAGAALLGGELVYTPASTDLGPQTVTLRASDPAGNTSFQSFTLDVRGPNTAPAFLSSPVTSVTAGGVYRYDADAVDADDLLTYSLVSPPAGMSIGPTTGVITWLTPQTPGTQSLTVRATDERGLFTDQTFSLALLADTTAPVVSILPDSTLLVPDETVSVQVLASDDVAVSSLSLTADGLPVTLDSQGFGSITVTAPGLIDLVATATDPAGNPGTVTETLRVIDPADTDAPEVLVTSPQPGDIVTYLTEITGTVSDPNFEFFQIAVAPDGSDQFTTVFTGTAEVLNGVLGAFDPTLLPNDRYEVKITAQDISGNIASFQFPLDVTASAKIGNFRLDFTDLQIPLAGIPITITRSYDTLEAPRQGDFGYGWSLGFADADIRETVRQNPLEPVVGSLYGAFPFRIGTRVYLNTPDGGRTAFTFDPVPEAGLLGTLFRPRFTPDPGTFERLEVEDVPLRQLDDGTFVLYFGGFNYNPSQYTLVTRDQLRYRYDQFAGLLDITDRNNVTLTYTDTGIFSSTGQSITWTRDALGRITQILDPAGNAINYDYDTAGNLIGVTDQVGNVTSMTYLADPVHYLDEVIDPRGITATRTEYDADGRILSITDALGNPITQSYDLAGNTEVIADRLGNETTLVFDDRGNIVSDVGPLGATFTITYDANDNQTSVVDPRGLTTQFEYDGNGNVTKVIDPVGNEWLQTFNSSNDLLTTADPLGRTTERIYDSNGNVIQFINATGDSMLVSRDSEGRPLSVTDYNGHTTQFTYSTGPDPISVTHPDGSTRLATYDIFSEITSFTNENGDQTFFTYDDIGRILSSRDALGNESFFTYDNDLLVSITNPLGQVTQFEHDDKGRRTRIIDANGGIQEIVYDANDRVIATIDQLGRRFDGVIRADGLVASITDPLGNVRSFSYDAAGNISAEMDENGHTTLFEYDEFNRLTKRVEASGSQWQFTYDAVGNQLSTIDANGHTTTFEYDALNRLTQRVDALGGIETSVYDDNGNLLSFTNANGQTTSFEYDSRNRLVREIDALGNFTTSTYDAFGNLTSFTDRRGHVTTYGYDAMNRQTSVTDAAGNVTQFTYDAVGNQTAITGPLGHTTQFVYDNLNRLVTITDQLSHATTFSYDAVGNPLTTTDPLNRTTTSVYDDLNRLISVTDPRGSLTQFTYDAVGNQTSVTDALNNVTQFVYDNVDQLIERIDPLGNSTLFAYDAVGNRTQIIDRNGNVRQFGYDALNRLTTESWTDVSQLGSPTTPTNVLAFSYDDVGNLLAASDAESSYTFTYDVLSRRTSADNLGTPGLPNVVLNYVYDAVGNVISATENQGVSVASTYDPRNLLVSRTWTGVGIDPARIEFGYDARGLRTSISRFADSTGTQQIGASTFAYDAKGRLTAISHVDSLSTVLADYAFQFDQADQLTQQTINGVISNYSYDDSGQLTAADHAVQTDEAYSYDANGNRITGGYVVGPGNRILSDGTFDYQYDAEGNLTIKTEIATGEYTVFSYDHRNRMVSAVKYSSGGIILSEATYTYDVFDRRIAKTVDIDGAGPQAAETTYTVYDGDRAWADFDSAGNVLARYLFGDRVDEILARFRPGEGTAWYLTDHLGSVRDIVDATGAVINTITYDSFGKIINETNPATGDRFKFTGREFDAETGLYYYRARFYDPQIGRFVSQDPLGFDAGDFNLYRYVGNSPLTATDPFGLVKISYSTLVNVSTRAANAAAGFAIGYACGYLEAWYKGDPNPHDTAISGAKRGAALGALLGLVPARFQLYVGIAFGIQAAATSDDFVVFGIRATCIAVQLGVAKGLGALRQKLLAQGRLTPPDPKVIREIKSLPDGSKLTNKQVAELNKNIDVILNKTLPAKAQSSKGSVQDVVNLFKSDSRFRFLDQVPGARQRINDALGKFSASLD